MLMFIDILTACFLSNPVVANLLGTTCVNLRATHAAFRSSACLFLVPHLI